MRNNICLYILVTSCVSEADRHIQFRKKFIQYSKEERQERREWCVQTLKLMGYCWPSLYAEPTPEELEMLKNENEK